MPLFQWSNPSLKDHLALFTHGVAGQWTIARTTGRDYLDQMTAEVREERVDTRGRIKVLWVQNRRDNQYLDCELMLHVAAIISGVLKTVSASPTEEGQDGTEISSPDDAPNPPDHVVQPLALPIVGPPAQD